jgi:hypothetical protein
MVFKSRTIAKVVSCRHFTAEARVRSRTSPCESYDGQSGNGHVFPPVLSISLVIIIPLVLHIFIYMLILTRRKSE